MIQRPNSKLFTWIFYVQMYSKRRTMEYENHCKIVCECFLWWICFPFTLVWLDRIANIILAWHWHICIMPVFILLWAGFRSWSAFAYVNNKMNWKENERNYLFSNGCKAYVNMLPLNKFRLDHVRSSYKLNEIQCQSINKEWQKYISIANVKHV